jgi:hypothetical protein
VSQEELEKFLSKADAVTSGKGPLAVEDFEDKKLDDSNIGMQVGTKAHNHGWAGQWIGNLVVAWGGSWM